MSETEPRLQKIKELSDEVAEKCKALSKWIVSSALETKRKYNQEKQQTERKQDLLQATIHQLKEENTRLLDERQSLALETETEAEEIKKAKEEQLSLEARVASAKKKAFAASQELQAIDSEIQQLEKRIAQEQEKEKRETKQALSRIEHYKKALGMSIQPTKTGAVEFLFVTPHGNHSFLIEINAAYVIHRATVTQSAYAKELEELNRSQDLFLFIRKMRDIFMLEPIIRTTLH